MGGVKQIFDNFYLVRPKIVLVLSVVLILVCISGYLMAAPTLTSAAPGADYELLSVVNPIPILYSGVTDIGVLKIELTNTGTVSPDDDAYIGQIEITLNSNDNLGTGSIEGAKAYLNNQTPIKYRTINSAKWPNEGALEIDSITKGVSTVTLTINNDASKNNMIPATQSKILWIAFDYADDTDTSPPQKTVGYYVSSIRYGEPPPEDNTAYVHTPSTLNDTADINRFDVTFDAEGLLTAVPAEGSQGAEVPVLKLTLGNASDEAVDKILSNLRLQYTGTDSRDVIAGGVKLYLDVGSDGFDGDPVDTLLWSGSISGGFATLTGVTGPDVTIKKVPRIYFVTVDVSVNATVGNTVGLQIADPSSDVDFEDSYGDGGADIDGEYDQVGFVDPDAAGYEAPTPATDTQFTVIPVDDGNPPYVVATIPDADAVDVSVSTISVIFSEDMDGTSVVDPANFTMVDDSLNTINGSFDYIEGPRMLLFTPSSPLAYETTYTATVTGAGVKDYFGNSMTEDYTWSFTTGSQYPTFTEPTIIKNRIGSGANSEALIFIPEPTGGPTEKVTVQVFTTTGRLVRTFYKNVPHSTIGTDPISWDGTNDRGENLGPGMYFVQIRTSSYKRVLKVMIVR